MRVPLFRNNIGSDEIAAIIEVLKGDWHTAGPINQKVEQLISEKFSTSDQEIHVALTNSCSTGLMAVATYLLKEKDELGSLNIGPTRKILTTPMTFIATAVSFMRVGIHPWFIDIDPETGLMDLDLLEAELKKRPHEFIGIWAVHLYGHPIDMPRLRRIADEYDLTLVEDAAHGFDTVGYGGWRPGQLSDAACFSFYATKEIHCGEGGAVISSDPELIKFVKQMTRHGLTKTANQSKLGNMGYDVDMLGWKGNLCDILAALLPSQIHQSESRQFARLMVADHYGEHLGPHVTPIRSKFGSSAWYTYPILCENRDKVKTSLEEHMIGHTIMYEALHNLKVCQGYNFSPKAEKFSQSQISLPCYGNVAMDLVIKAVNDAA